MAFDIRPRYPALSGQTQRPDVFASLIEQLGQLPQKVQANQLARQQQQVGQLQFAQAQRAAMPIEQASPELYQTLLDSGVDVKGRTVAEIKDLAPLLDDIIKKRATPTSKRVLTPEQALKEGSVVPGTIITRPTAKTMPEQVTNRIIQAFNSDPEVRKQNSMIDASNTINGLIQSNNPIADAAIPTFMARASGEVGNLSEADKAPFGGSQSLSQRIIRTIEKAASGRLDETDRQFVLQLSDVMQRTAAFNFNRLAEQRAKQYSRANKNLKYEDLLATLNPAAEVSSSVGQGAPEGGELYPGAVVVPE